MSLNLQEIYREFSINEKPLSLRFRMIENELKSYYVKLCMFKNDKPIEINNKHYIMKDNIMYELDEMCITGYSFEIIDLGELFLNTINLDSIELANTKIKSISIAHNSWLRKIDFRNCEINNGEDYLSLRMLFYNMPKLKEIKFNNSYVIYNMDYLFKLSGVEEIDLSDFDITYVDNFLGTFEHCRELKIVKFGKHKLRALNTFRNTFMFSSVEEIDFSEVTSYNVVDFIGCFIMCEQLKRVHFGSLQIRNITNDLVGLMDKNLQEIIVNRDAYKCLIDLVTKNTRLNRLLNIIKVDNMERI